MCKLDTHANNILEDQIWPVSGKMNMFLCWKHGHPGSQMYEATDTEKLNNREDLVEEGWSTKK